MTKITFLHGARDRLQAVAAWLAHAGGEVERGAQRNMRDYQTDDEGGHGYSKVI